jgi:hypothetical protein
VAGDLVPGTHALGRQDDQQPPRHPMLILADLTVQIGLAVFHPFLERKPRISGVLAEPL